MGTGKTTRESYIRIRGEVGAERKWRKGGRQGGIWWLLPAVSLLVCEPQSSSSGAVPLFEAASHWLRTHQVACACEPQKVCLSLPSPDRAQAAWLLAVHRCFNFSVFACHHERGAIETKIHSYLFMYFSIYILLCCVVCVHISSCV